MPLVDTVSRYYNLARTNSYYGFANANCDDFPLVFLQCDAICSQDHNHHDHASTSSSSHDHRHHNQATWRDCRAYSDD